MSVLLRNAKAVVAVAALLALFSAWLLTRANFQLAFEPKSYLSAEESRLHEKLSAKGARESLVVLTAPSDVELARLALLATGDVENVFTDPKFDFFQLSDGRRFLIAELRRKDFLSITESRALVGKLHYVLRGLSYSLVGSSPTRVAVHEQFRRDVMFVLVPLGLFLLFLPYLFFGSWNYVVVPGLAALLGTLVSFAAYGFFGRHFNYFSLTLVPVLICLSLLDATYFVDAVFSKWRRGHERVKAVADSVKEHVIPCALTVGTTILGFLSVALTSQTPLLWEYGMFATLGVLLSFGLLMTVVPAGLCLLPMPSKKSQKRNALLGRKITRVALWCSAFPRLVVAGFAVVTIVSLFYSYRVSIRSAPEKVFSGNSSVQRDVDALVEHLGSLSPVVLTLTSSTPRESSNFRYLMYGKFLEDYAKSLPFVGRTLSPLSSVSVKSPSWGKFREAETKVEAMDFKELASRARGSITVDEAGKLTSIRILAWPRSLSQKEDQTLRLYLDNFFRTMMEEFRVEVSGPHFLMKSVERRFLGDAVKGFLYSALLVLLVTLLAIPSLRYALVFLVVNTVPMLPMFGVMGACRIPFQLALSELPGILFGIVVDDTTHFLWCFRKTKSLRVTFARKGRAAAVTGCLLFVAFGGQVFSGFVANVQFGGLAAVGVGFAVLTDLLLLPAMTRLFLEKKRGRPEPTPLRELVKAWRRKSFRPSH